MALMDRHTGLNIDDKAHLIQSIQDIVTTPKGTRVIVRDFGCMLPYMIDKPINRQWVIDAFGEIAIAIDKWEPRFTLKRVILDANSVSQGVLGLTVEGIYKPLGRVIRLENIVLKFESSTL